MDREGMPVSAEGEAVLHGKQQVKKAYAKAELMVHGDLREITGRPS